MGITRLTYNWRIVSDGHQTIDCADEYNIGQNGVVSIEEHQAMGSGDRWLYNVLFDNGNELKVFNPNTVLTTP